MQMYPGTDDFFIQRERRLRHGAQRRQDLWSGLAAAPTLFQTLGSLRIEGDRAADDRLLAQRLLEAQQNPEGALPPGVEGPNYPPEVAAAHEAANAPEEGFWHRLARSVTLGASGDYQPRMTAAGASQVGEVARAGRSDFWNSLVRDSQVRRNDAEARKADRWRPSAGGGGDPTTSPRLLSGALDKLDADEAELTRTLENPTLDLGYTPQQLMQFGMAGVKPEALKFTPEQLQARRKLIEGRLNGIRARREDMRGMYDQRRGGAPASGGGTTDPLKQKILKYAADNGLDPNELEPDQIAEILLGEVDGG